MFLKLLTWWILAELSIIIALNGENITQLRKTGLINQMDEQWMECCRNTENVCSQNSCYYIIYRNSTWSSIRNRCQGRYPDFPYAVDLTSLTQKEDIDFIWDLVLKANDYKSIPELKGFWTSVTRCAKESTVVYGTLKQQRLPQCLEDELKNLQPMIKHEDCQFLVINPRFNKAELEYEFQDENIKKAGLCQFMRILDKETSTSSSTVEMTTITTAIKPTAEESRKQSISFKTTQVPYTTLPPDIGTSSGLFLGCKSRVFGGIHWPDTPSGVTVRMPCPQGTVGTTEWTCDAATLKFIPDKPNYENCRHEWLMELEEEVEKGKEDAVVMSKLMANKTTSNVLSHGDLSCIVKIIKKVLVLYKKQKIIEQEVNEKKTPSSYHLTQAVLTVYSHVLRSDLKQAWSDLNQAHQEREASAIIMQTATVGHHLSCSRISDDDLQYTLLKENINLQTFFLDYMGQKKMPFSFPKFDRLNNSHPIEQNLLLLPGNLTLEKKPKSTCENNAQTAVGRLYKQIGQFLGTRNKSESIVATAVMGFSLGNATVSVSLPNSSVVMDLKHMDFDKPLVNPRCVFWNFSRGNYGEWDHSGCQTLFTNKTHTRCSCNHLTNFAVLMDIEDKISPNDKILELMTYVCCGLSTICLLTTFFCLLIIRSLHCRRSSITCNLTFCLFFVNIIVIFALKQTKLQIVCNVIAGALHFFLLSAFCWMLLEGYHLYRMVAIVFSQISQVSMKYFYCFAYGVPALVVITTGALTRENYRNKDFCWISNSNDVIWSFVGPICGIMLINLCVFILTMRSAASLKIKKERTTAKNITSMMKGSFSIMCLLGLTWCVGLLYAVDIFYFSSFIFIGLNGLQGVFIFVFHIMCNEKVKSLFGEILHGKIKWYSKNTKTSNVTSSVSNQHNAMKSPAHRSMVSQRNHAVNPAVFPS